jgi:TrmH family RNA methyltransferase
VGVVPESVHNRLASAGPSHPRVRQFLNVKHNRGPQPRTAIALEGAWAVGQAVAAGLDIEVLFVCDALRRGGNAGIGGECDGDGVRRYAVSERVMRRMVDRDGPDGIAAIAHLRPHALDTVEIGPDALVVIADRLELAGNLGTLIRCADGAGVSAVILTDRRVRIAQHRVAKASMGTLFTMPVVDADIDAVLAWTARLDFRLIAADPGTPLSYRRADYRGRVAVVVGSERHGLSDRWRAAADALVSIPMRGMADSLNVGHAAALLLYEAAGVRGGADG